MNKRNTKQEGAREVDWLMEAEDNPEGVVMKWIRKLLWKVMAPMLREIANEVLLREMLLGLEDELLVRYEKRLEALENLLNEEE